MTLARTFSPKFFVLMTTSIGSLQLHTEPPQKVIKRQEFQQMSTNVHKFHKCRKTSEKCQTFANATSDLIPCKYPHHQQPGTNSNSISGPAPFSFHVFSPLQTTTNPPKNPSVRFPLEDMSDRTTDGVSTCLNQVSLSPLFFLSLSHTHSLSLSLSLSLRVMHNACHLPTV